ncbi:hypothetical protein PR048_009482 [Dryococelus australis]|uniref:Uncharacterized protein n=1 Tax=Dryococelus australis TaxID=614101 RepID=A0ABQ9I003_9NEOP|nr:hypothetical protein PR048_009482 [Dryococelus australis]
MEPHKNKTSGLMSGDRGGHEMGPSRPILRTRELFIEEASHFLPPVWRSSILLEEHAAQLPPRRTRVQSPAGSLPDFRMWESCQTMPLLGVFFRGSPVSPTRSFRRCSILTSTTLIGSRDPNLFTHLLSLANRFREIHAGVSKQPVRDLIDRQSAEELRCRYRQDTKESEERPVTQLSICQHFVDYARVKHEQN